MSLKIRETAQPISESLKDKKRILPSKESADAFCKQDKISNGRTESATV